MVDFDDMQALVRSGFGSLGGARYVLLRIADATRAKLWLARLEPTRASQIGRGHDLRCAIQIAFTRAGLIAAGFTDAELATMAPEFLEGMASNERRSHRLGDVGQNAPEHWSWGAGNREPHVLIVLLAKQAMIADWASGIEVDALANGFAPIASFDSCPAHEDGSRAHEPFGFADGLSQPIVDWDGGHAASPTADRDYRPNIAAGEIVLGYTNEYGVSAGNAGGPLVQPGGSYLVYRQLEQDVTGFWQWAAEAAGPERARWMAERVVGRCIDGSPLPGLARGDGPDDFLFNDDPNGIACPIGAHIRRANPRSGDDPLGRRGFLRDLVSSVGLEGTATADAVASARFHRILRRGRPYGATLTPEAAMRPEQPQIEAGLHFLCLNASLARQFEFVQGAWLMTPTFAGLSQEGDPLLGNRCPFPDGRRTDLFRYRDLQGVPRIAQSMPRFVTVRGGAYFFLPGIAGLKSIASR